MMFHSSDGNGKELRISRSFHPRLLPIHFHLEERLFSRETFSFSLLPHFCVPQGDGISTHFAAVNYGVPLQPEKLDTKENPFRPGNLA